MADNGNGSKLILRSGHKSDSEFVVCTKTRDFLVDYMNRHAHPVNAALHIIGVPAAFAGFFFLFSGKSVQRGGLLIFLGYLLQYLGHKAQGNEVGEVTLARNIYRKIRKH